MKSITCEVKAFTGKPKKDGRYVCVMNYDTIYTYDYTVEYGWNTSENCHKYPIPKENVNYWISIEDFKKLLEEREDY